MLTPLNEVVFLLTQSADDIPFDLTHRPRIVYGEKITERRSELPKRFAWATGLPEGAWKWTSTGL